MQNKNIVKQCIYLSKKFNFLKSINLIEIITTEFASIQHLAVHLLHFYISQNSCCPFRTLKGRTEHIRCFNLGFTFSYIVCVRRCRLARKDITTLYSQSCSHLVCTPSHFGNERENFTINSVSSLVLTMERNTSCDT